jgi:hypothetical protein
MLHGRLAAIMGVDLRGSRAWNPSSQVIVPHFEKYQCFGWQCSKASMDDEDCHSYPFHNACMTESIGVELGPFATARFGAWGKEPN